jgi:hypothetical protein
MNWNQLAENRIAEAIANGEFDNLPGTGQPIDLAEYFAVPAAERAGTALLKNANVVPPEVELWRSIAELERALAAAESPGRTKQISSLREELQEKRVALALALERRRRRDPRVME